MPPGYMAAAIEAARGALLEAAAENDEELLNKYLEEGDLSPDEIRKGIAEGIAAGDLVRCSRHLRRRCRAWRASSTA